MGLFDALYSGLGWLMETIYSLVNNYGLAIIIFTILTKVVLFPLSLKQQKSAAQMQKVKPLLEQAQKKYANNKQKLNEETMKIYQEYGINPAGGCLPLLIQLPFIWALYRVIQQPYTYILHWKLEDFAVKLNLDADKIADRINKMREEIKIVAEAGKANEFINFDFLGLDLSATPEISKPSLLWIIPIIAAVLTFMQSKFMYAGLSKEEMELRKGKKAKDPNARPPRPGEKQDNSAEQMTNSMTYFMPLMTLWFTFILPAGIGLYWIVGSLLQIVLTYISNKFIIPNMKVKVKGGNANDIEAVRTQLREKRKNS